MAIHNFLTFFKWKPNLTKNRHRMPYFALTGDFRKEVGHILFDEFWRICFRDCQGSTPSFAYSIHRKKSVAIMILLFCCTFDKKSLVLPRTWLPFFSLPCLLKFLNVKGRIYPKTSKILSCILNTDFAQQHNLCGWSNIKALWEKGFEWAKQLTELFS